jgi:hypothetical protein
MEKEEGMVVGIEESVAIVGRATEVVKHFIYIALASQAKMTMYNR